MRTIILFISLIYLPSALSQQLFEMAHKNLDPITIQLKNGSKQSIECNEFKLLKRVIVPLIGTGVTDYAYIDELSLKTVDNSAAKIKLVVYSCPKFYSAEPQSYYISLVFYDKNREPLFGHNFISDYGENEFEVHTDLQATKMSASEDIECFTLQGEETLAIHHNFMIDPKPDEASDPLQELVEPVATVAIRIYMLGSR